MPMHSPRRSPRGRSGCRRPLCLPPFDSVPLRLDECVGYRVPLFVGRRDEVSNLERTKMDVYGSLSGQARKQTRQSPTGTVVAELTCEKPRRGLRRRGH